MYIVGASTLGEIIVGIAERCGFVISGFYDDLFTDSLFCKRPVIGKISEMHKNTDLFEKGAFIAIGNNQNRCLIFNKIRSMGIPIRNIIDSKAILEANVQMGEGNLIMACAYLGTNTSLGNGNLIFPSVSLTHHNTIGSFNFFSPNASVGGYTIIGDECKIAMNCSVAPYINILDGSTSAPCSVLSGAPVFLHHKQL